MRGDLWNHAMTRTFQNLDSYAGLGLTDSNILRLVSSC